MGSFLPRGDGLINTMTVALSPHKGSFANDIDNLEDNRQDAVADVFKKGTEIVKTETSNKAGKAVL